MGRPVFYRQRISNQALPVQAKSLLTHLASEIQARREIFRRVAFLDGSLSVFQAGSALLETPPPIVPPQPADGQLPADAGKLFPA